MDPSPVMPDLTWVAPTFTAILAGLLGIAATFFARAGRKAQQVAEAAEPVLPLDKKIQLVAVTTGELSRLNDEIKAEFQLQLIEVEKLQREAEDAKGAAALHKEAAEAVQTLVKSGMREVSKENAKRDRLFQILLSAFFFVLGIGATLIIQAITGSV